MGYQMRGWHSHVVEVGYEAFTGQPDLARLIADTPTLAMWVKRLPHHGGQAPNMAMVEGMTEQVAWLKVECPAYAVGVTYMELHRLLSEFAPRPRKEP